MLAHDTVVETCWGTNAIPNPPTFHNLQAPVGVLDTVEFEIARAQDTEAQSVAEIHVYDVGRRCPKGTPGSLTDRRLGATGRSSDIDGACGTCEGYSEECPGHFGHIKLRVPNYHIGTLSRVKMVLECMCTKCGRLKMGPRHPTTTSKNTLSENLADNVSLFRRRVSASRQLPSVEGTFRRQYWDSAKDKQHCWHCGSSHGGIRMMGTSLFWTRKAEMKVVPVELRAPEVYEILKRLDLEDWRFLAPSVNYDPTDLLLTVLPVPPPAIRPRINNSGKSGTKSSYSDDVLTELLSNIIKANNQILDRRGDGEQILQTNLHLYLDARRVSAKMTGGRCNNTKAILSLAPRLAGKEGRMRQHIQGKRVDFSARTVATGDPNIAVDEIGIPRLVATGLSRAVRVTPHNYLYLTDLVHRGPDHYPGANMIHSRADSEPGGILESPVTPGTPGQLRSLDLRVRARRDLPAPALQIGDIVDRHLIDGDTVMVNRQPSLHKMSMMAHRVRVLGGQPVLERNSDVEVTTKYTTRWRGGGNTFRLNLSVTTPYNGDFDGDEFNIHVPQDEEAAAECAILAGVEHHLVSPQSNKPVMGIVQDDLQGIYQITGGCPDRIFGRRQAYTLMVAGGVYDPAELGPPHNNKGWTGPQIFSSLLPTNLNYNHEGVIIKKGQLLRGPLTKTHLGPGKHNGLLQQVWLLHGEQFVFKFIHQLQQLATAYLMEVGFSVGIGDMIKPRSREAIEQIDQALGNVPNCFELRGHQLVPHLMKQHNQLGAERTAIRIGNANAAITNIVDKSGRRHGPIKIAANNVQMMTDSGSKGSRINMAQMSGCVGPQQLGGQPMQRVFGHLRTLPHYHKGHYSAVSLGFVANSYLQGLDPAEFFFHSVAAREGLIDTACKTGDVGYISRRMIKATESISLHYDGTVRNAMNEIVQLRYGQDGFDAQYIEQQTVDTLDVMTGGMINQTSSYRWPTTERQQLVDDDHWLQKEMGWDTNLKIIDNHQPVNLVGLLDQHSPDPNCPLDHCGPLAEPEWIQKLVAKLLNVLKIDVKWPLYCRLLRRAWNSAALISRGYTEGAAHRLVSTFTSCWHRAVAQPGENVGVLASQSLAEILVQITLNSVDGATSLLLRVDGELIRTTIGDFVDERLLKASAADIEAHPNDTELAWLKEKEGTIEVLAGQEDGSVSWQQVRAVTRHPVLTGKLLEVRLSSGRILRATKAKSFVTVDQLNGTLVPTMGTDLHVGDLIPVAISRPAGTMSYFDVNDFKRAEVDSRDIPDTITMDFDFGWLCAMYTTKGSIDIKGCNINFKGMEAELHKKISQLGVRYYVNIKHYGTSTFLNSRVLAQLFAGMFGKESSTKRIDPRLFDAPDCWLAGFLSGYIDGDGFIGPSSIELESTNKFLMEDISSLSARFGALGQLSMSTANTHILKWRFRSAVQLKQHLQLVLTRKMDALQKISGKSGKKVTIVGGVVGDPIVEIKEIPWPDKVYDLTVDGFKTFNSYDNVVYYDTFHSTGTSSAVVTEGVPRLKENIDVVPNIKTPVMNIKLKAPYLYDQQLANKIAVAMRWTRLEELVTKTEIYYCTLDSVGSTIQEDQEWTTIYNQVYQHETFRDKNKRWSNWVGRLELDTQQMEEHQVTIYQVQTALEEAYPTLSVITTPDTSQHQIIHVRMSVNKDSSDNDGDFMRYFIPELVHYTTIKGIHGVSKTYVIPYTLPGQTTPAYQIQTAGTNLAALSTWRHVDLAKCTTNHPLAIYEYVGLDSSLRTLQLELKKTIQEGASYINARHFDILTLTQSHYGRLLSLTRHGINQVKSAGALAKCSFEQSEKVLMDSAMNGSVDTLCSVSSRITVAKHMLSGTGSFDVILDQEKLLVGMKEDEEKVGSKRRAQ